MPMPLIRSSKIKTLIARFSILVFFIIVSAFILPKLISAACWCANGWDDGCQCGRTGTSSYQTEFGGVTVYCDKQEELNSLFTIKAPVCGSSPEIIPYCAPQTGPAGNSDDPTWWMCWGTTFARGSPSDISSPGTWNFPGKFCFNGFCGFGADSDTKVVACGDNNYCCGGDPQVCDGSGVPEKPDSCIPQPPPSPITPNPACEDAGIFPDSDGESRLWFSNTRLISTLSAMAQTMFNPFGLNKLYDNTAFSKNAPPSDRDGGIDNYGAITTKVEEHQGIDDDTQVVNKTDNNSSVRSPAPAPLPLDNKDLYGDDLFYDEFSDRACYIPDTVSNPGDDLIGAKILGEVFFTKAFSYKAKGRPLGCGDDGGSWTFQGTLGEWEIADANTEICAENCCSAICTPQPYSNDCLAPGADLDDNPICPPAPDGLESGFTRECPSNTNLQFCCTTENWCEQTEVVLSCGSRDPQYLSVGAEVNYFSKTPLVENLYATILEDEDSLFRRFMPQLDQLTQDDEFEFEKIPTKSAFGASASILNYGTAEPGTFRSEYAKGQAPGPEIYFPLIGSFSKYWLDDFQDAIRPLEFASLSSGDPFEPPIEPPPVAGECYPGPAPYSADLDSVIDDAIGRGQAAALVPRGALEAIYYIESFGQWNNNAYTCTPNAATATGLMQITDGAYNWVVPPSQRMTDAGQCALVAGKLTRCNPADAMELAARVLLVKIGEWDFANFVPTTGAQMSSVEEVYCGSCAYYGSTDPDNATNNRGVERNVPPNPGDGKINYCEMVCYDDGTCTADDFPWPRPPATNCRSAF